MSAPARQSRTSIPLRLVFDEWGEPNPRKIEQAVEILHRGGVVAYPTDSIYALGCAIESRDAIERIYRAKNMNRKQKLALICPDLSTASAYGQFSNTAFRLANRIFPGPYTLVVPATHEVPRMLTHDKRRTVGIRITSHPIAQALAAGLGRPLLTSSAVTIDPDEPDKHLPCRDAEEVLEAFGRHIDCVIDAPQTQADPSTVIEVDGDTVTVIREGQGSLDVLD
jgi:tRNA threonylcarbamoyl adenosine modification protein (Sua5/YciO/YrdC/YwlC family)